MAKMLDGMSQAEDAVSDLQAALERLRGEIEDLQAGYDNWVDRALEAEVQVEKLKAEVGGGAKSGGGNGRA